VCGWLQNNRRHRAQEFGKSSKWASHQHTRGSDYWLTISSVHSLLFAIWVQVNSGPIQDEDFFVVLGSDGVWDHLTDQEACDIGMQSFGRPQESARKICQAAFDNESEDNITALVVESTPSHHLAHFWLTIGSITG